MNQYVELAREYFRYMEGLHLYPSWRNYRLWVWVASTALWFGSFYYSFFDGTRAHGYDPIVSVLPFEFLWIAVSFWISEWKDAQLVATTNYRLGTSFIKASECRRHVLHNVMGLPSTDYLKMAKEISDLVDLRRKFGKRSDFELSSLWKFIYDRDSKARLLALVIALVSVTITLAVRNNANLESVIEVYSTAEGQKMFLFISVTIFAIYLFSVGLSMVVPIIIDTLALWCTKVFGTSLSSSWVLSYLARDLIVYYEVRPHTDAVESMKPAKTSNMEPAAESEFNTEPAVTMRLRVVKRVVPRAIGLLVISGRGLLKRIHILRGQGV